jgi:hypothetical protein
MTVTDLSRSNSLADLAARIRSEHEASSAALSRGVVHAIAAGQLLAEAKAQVPHGQWLPWLEENCAMSVRTAQLYMRIAKGKPALREAEIRNDVAHLTMNDAAEMVAPTLRAARLVGFVRRLEGATDPEAFVSLCVAEGVRVIRDDSYDQFAGRSPDEIRDWHLFTLFLGGPDVASHVEWIMQRPFQNVAEWLGEEGDKFRQRCCMHPVPQKHRDAWAAFLEANGSRTTEEIVAELNDLNSRQSKTAARQKRAKR